MIVPKWLLAHLTTALAVGSLAAFSVWRIADIHHQREIGRLDVLQHQQDSLIQAQSHRIDSVKSAFRTDTVRLARTIRSYQTVHDTLNVVLHDTTVQRDTLIQVVERYRDRADSVVQDCRTSLVGCTAILTRQDTLVRSLQMKVTLQQSQQGHWGPVLSAVKWLGLGFAAGYVYGKH